ncbi:MAG: YncE family protein [Solirubrobacteraceae bacterium]|nr:YncE family protein [Solirubrobacteraceae bacterium]
MVSHFRHLASACCGVLMLLAVGATASQANVGSLARMGQATGAGGLRAVATSPDGRHVYAVAQAESRLIAYRREASGLLTAIDTETDGAGGVATLGGALAVAVAPDGLSVYVAAGGDNAVTSFTRDAVTGALTLQGCVNETGASSCDAGSGLNGAEGIAVSPDNTTVYVTAPNDHAVNILPRNTSNGDLGYAGCVTDLAAPESCALKTQGLAQAQQVVVSPDGKNVYVTGRGDNAVVNLSRSSDGTLTPRNCVSNTGGMCNSATPGLLQPRGLAISPDGASVYVAGQANDTVVAFTRTAPAGDLNPLDLEQNGVGAVRGLDGPEGLAVSPDGASVYAASVDSEALAGFVRDAAGRLSFQECFKDGSAGSGCAGAEGLNDANAIAVPVDGTQVFVSSRGDASVTIFAREIPAPPPGGGGSGGDPGTPGAGGPPGPGTPNTPLICVGLWTSTCAGFPPPSPVQTCVSLWQNCTGFGGKPPAGPGTIDLSGFPTSVTTKAGCDERTGANPFTAKPRQAPVTGGPASRDGTTCLIQIHLEGTDPNSADDVAYATLVRQFNAEVDQMKGEHVQGVIASCTGVDLNCQRATEVLALFLADVVEKAFDAAKPPGKPVAIVALDLQRANALCQGSVNVLNCTELFRKLNESIGDHLRLLKARKAALGLDKPRKAAPRSAPGVATAAARKRLKVVLGSGRATLTQGRAGKVKLVFSPQARKILRTARRRGMRALKLTAITRATIVPGVSATKRTSVKVLLTAPRRR